MRNLYGDILKPLVKGKDVSSFQEKPVSSLQVFLLESLHLLPILTTYGVVSITHDAIITLIAFFSGMTVLLWIYCSFYKQDMKSIWFGDGLEKRGQQLKLGALGGFGILALLLGVYCGFLGIEPLYTQWRDSLNIPVKRTLLNGVVFVFLYSFINPVLEELFWRAFLLKGYQNRKLAYVSTTFHYALYHFFVVYYIANEWIFPSIATVAILVFGALLMYLREKHGMIAAIVTHAGADLAVAIACCHICSGITL